MINFAEKTSGYNEPVNDYSKVSLGIKSGLSTTLWNRRVTYGRLGASYLITYPVKVGPFEAENFSGSVSIPEASVGFGHLIVMASFGLKI
jgi:hypothetical protein